MTRFNALKAALAAAIAMACTSCVSSEIVVPEGAPTAQFLFAPAPGLENAGYYGRPDLQLLFSRSNAQCKPRLPMPLIGTQAGFEAMKAPIAIESGKRLFMSAISNQATAVGRSSCVNVASFVPETGHDYEAYQQWSPQGPSCRLVVIDKATGRAPASFEEHPVVQACR
ncbi:MAG: hypothetical protein EON95_16340 [Caulobacteraceae bacterium]|nr:MAG: hypothetical protein EON95_16340 [Caulobacteraceae bacterium]